MKTYSADAIAALEAGEVITVGAVKIATADPFRVWGGEGILALSDGGKPPENYVGIGDRGLVKATGSQLGGSEQGVELVLSGVDSDIIPLVQAGDARGAAVTIWRLLFNSSGSTLLAAHVFQRGRVDGLPIEDVGGGSAVIRCKVENAARGMGRQTGRMRSDADQRLIDATDGGLQFVTQAPTRTLAWGGKPPARAGAALPNLYGTNYAQVAIDRIFS